MLSIVSCTSPSSRTLALSHLFSKARKMRRSAVQCSNIRKRTETPAATLLVAAIILIWPQAVQADYIPLSLDVAGTRVPMAGEGYLAFSPFPRIGGNHGNEYTGWIDVRAPWSAGGTNVVLGYDRSDHFVTVRSTVLTDNTGAVAPNDRATDFNYANRVYMSQAGLSVIEQGAPRSITSPAAGQPGSFQFPLDPSTPSGSALLTRILQTNNGPAPTIEVYYAQLASSLLGATLNPSQTAGTPPQPLPEGIYLSNLPTAPDTGFPDTFAHELYHFIGDTLTHAADPRNLFADGNVLWSPGMKKGYQDGNNVPPWDIRQSPDVVGPAMSTNADGSPRVGGIDQLTHDQVTQIFAAASGAAPFLQLGQHQSFGDRIDWNFVADQLNIEGIPRADNNGNAGDPLFWRIGSTQASDETGHDHTGLGVFGAKGDYAGETFRFADVFSLVANYADSDIDSVGFRSVRSSALDYDVIFWGVDPFGHDLFGNGIPRTVFDAGWSDLTSADNFLARWESPFAARGVLVFPHQGDGRDGSVQIDAIIVAAPEPPSIALVGIASLLLWSALQMGRNSFRRQQRVAGRNPGRAFSGETGDQRRRWHAFHN